MGLGMDKFNLGTAPAARVTVSIAFGANAGAVSEHLLMLMLATYRHLALAGRKLREGIWLRPQLRAECYQLSGKAVDLFGFGDARMMAHRLAGFEVEIIYSDIRRAEMVTERSLRASQVPYDMATERVDMLSIHVPLTAAIKGLIGAETIARMKTGALIINAARHR